MKECLFTCKCFQKKTCVFPAHARMEVIVNHRDSLSNATAHWATKENTAKVSNGSFKTGKDMYFNFYC